MDPEQWPEYATTERQRGYVRQKASTKEEIRQKANAIFERLDNCFEEKKEWEALFGCGSERSFDRRKAAISIIEGLL